MAGKEKSVQKRIRKKANAVIPERSAGVLLHVSSLPGKYGIGTMGKEARAFVDFLCEAGFGYWQVLPLVQTGYGDSPYQSVFGASGNPYLIDPETLAEDGLLKKSELASCRVPNTGKADYSYLHEYKIKLLRRAFSRFDAEKADFVQFCEEGGFKEYALFMALRGIYGESFIRWEKPLRFHEGAALEKFYRENEREVLFWQFVQFEFFRQWRKVKDYANARGIKIVGDIPLYVAYDSADVWANPRLFKLNKNLTRKKVAGVPPDYFSATGQLWGNPVYDWKVHEGEGFAWWIDRIRRAFALYDVVRIDHFRGFDRYFEIDATEDTAMSGRWKKGPGAKLFAAAQAALGKLDFIAEDLGTLDAGVYRLMRRTGYPGMKVMQFAFDGNPGNPYLPCNIDENSVCYTGTHDNNTLVGFLEELKPEEGERLREALRPLLKDAKIPVRLNGNLQTAKAMRALAISVRSNLSVLPAQDILLTGAETRMNVPSIASGNWSYRLRRGMTCGDAKKCRALLMQSGRLNEQKR